MMHLEILAASCKSTVDDETQSDTMYCSSAGKASRTAACTCDKQTRCLIIVLKAIFKARNQDNEGIPRETAKIEHIKIQRPSETSMSAQEKRCAGRFVPLVCRRGPHTSGTDCQA